GMVVNNFQSGLRCAPVNGWFIALHRHAGDRQGGDKIVTWKAGDFHWHSYTPLQNQLIILEQFDQLPVILLSARHNELANGAATSSRWVSNTKSINKRTGKMVFDLGPRPASPAPQFTAFLMDLKNGAINMIGYAANNTLQHFIDDGRKPADVSA